MSRDSICGSKEEAWTPKYVLKGVSEGDGGDEGGEEGAGEGGSVEEGGKDGHCCGGSKRIKDRWRARQEWKETGCRWRCQGMFTLCTFPGSVHVIKVVDLF